ncbi:hypothetical protein ACFFIS_00975 [Virgibacillus soli]|uniref:Uncharacterized protein n=1 Tax=Paracerasibacillus soli TaxID=480284 RepID=A0ABU5CQ37_9BACI|nr:hypothetical protein [Virgibacillus soli]MDY0408335.1 hypothetical protein [Virgibacillus soli]
MMETKETVDQAAQLRKHISHEQSTESQQENNELLKIDILKLPPRSEVHKNNTRGMKLKFSKPLKRLFFTFLLCLICLFGLYYIWDKGYLNDLFIR